MLRFLSSNVSIRAALVGLSLLLVTAAIESPARGAPSPPANLSRRLQDALANIQRAGNIRLFTLADLQRLEADARFVQNVFAQWPVPFDATFQLALANVKTNAAQTQKWALLAQANGGFSALIRQQAQLAIGSTQRAQQAAKARIIATGNANSSIESLIEGAKTIGTVTAEEVPQTA